MRLSVLLSFTIIQAGDPTPSKEDILVTKTLYQAGRYIGIRLLDHLIIGEQKYESLARFICESLKTLDRFLRECTK